MNPYSGQYGGARPPPSGEELLLPSLPSQARPSVPSATVDGDSLRMTCGPWGLDTRDRGMSWMPTLWCDSGHCVVFTDEGEARVSRPADDGDEAEHVVFRAEAWRACGSVERFVGLLSAALDGLGLPVPHPALAWAAVTAWRLGMLEERP